MNYFRARNSSSSIIVHMRIWLSLQTQEARPNNKMQSRCTLVKMLQLPNWKSFITISARSLGFQVFFNIKDISRFFFFWMEKHNPLLLVTSRKSMDPRNAKTNSAYTAPGLFHTLLFAELWWLYLSYSKWADTFRMFFIAWSCLSSTSRPKPWKQAGVWTKRFTIYGARQKSRASKSFVYYSRAFLLTSAHLFSLLSVKWTVESSKSENSLTQNIISKSCYQNTTDIYFWVIGVKRTPEPIPLEISNIILLQVRIKYIKMFRILSITLNMEPVNCPDRGKARQKECVCSY